MNEICVCRQHHTQIHEGLLHVEGIAPYGLTWTTKNGTSVKKYVSRPPEEKVLFEKTGRKVSPQGDGDPPFEDTTIYSLDEVPDMISREWWKKYGHNFRFEGNRLLLKHSG